MHFLDWFIIQPTRETLDYHTVRENEAEEMQKPERMNADNEKYLQSIKWNAPRVYDKKGILKVPTLKSLYRYRDMCIPDGMHPDTLKMILSMRRKEKVYTPHYDEEYWNTIEYIGDKKKYMRSRGRQETQT